MKSFLSLVFVLLLSQPAVLLAGDSGRHGHHMERMMETLQLDEGQTAKVREIMKEQHEKFRAAFHEAGGDRGDRRERFEALHQETRARLAEVLNDEQLARFDEMHAKHREKMKEFMEKHASEKAALREKLQLSDEQASKVETIMREQHEKRRALFKAEGSREDKRAGMKSLHEETRARLAEVLDADQMAKLEEHWKSHRYRHGGKRHHEGSGND
jgi:Spy/CpxP family protein refolding chaperone